MSGGAIYDKFITEYDPAYNISYTSATPSYVYPDSNQINSMGPLYLPRIYGKDLTSFEIASSGTIALTLSDINSIILKRNVATSNLSLITLSNDSFGIYTNNSNMKLTFDATPGGVNNATLYSACNVFINANSNIQMNAVNNINVSASNMFTNVSSNLSVAASNDVSLISKRDFGIGSSNNFNVVIKQDTNLTSSNINMVVNSNIIASKTIGQIQLSSMAGNSTITMSEKYNVNIYAASNIKLGSKNDDVFVNLDSLTKNITASASNNMTVTALHGSTFVNASAGEMSLEMAAGTKSTLLYTSNVLTFSSSNNTKMRSVNNFDIYAATSNVSLVFDQPTNSATITGLSNVSINATNGFMKNYGGTAIAMSTAQGSSFTLSNNNNSYLVASNILFDAGVLGSIVVNTKTLSNVAADSINYKVGGNDILHIVKDTVTLNGNLDILGTVNSINTTITELYVQDKLIALAHSSNNDVVDGVLNTVSGIMIEGLPKSTDSNIPSNIATVPTSKQIYEKSIKWNYNDTDTVENFVGSVGIGGIGTSLAESESYWEMLGGSLRISANKTILKADGTYDSMKKITFGLRINQRDELEFVKKYYDTTKAKYVMKKVAQFGRTMM